jgi:site-specific DNA-cytosine methylase
MAHLTGPNEQLRELALFAGAGGGILGGHLLGWRCVCAVEWEPYPAGVLIARQNEGILPPFPIWDDVRTFDGHPWRGLVDVVSGGFPCQDISIAGKGDGLDGERSGMWTHMARIIGEVQPRFAFVENSPMLTSRGLDRVLADLSTMGYDAVWGTVSAADTGAPHRRERIWILAYTNSIGHGSRGEAGDVHQAQWRPNDELSSESRSASSRNGQHPIGQLAYSDLLGCLHGQAEERTAIGGVYAQCESKSSGPDVAYAERIRNADNG